MSDKVKIGHAVSDENGGSDGSPGDQTGKEIRVQDWYKRDGGWDYYLECTDEELAKKAAKLMTDICNSSNFGYSKKSRWSGYNALLASNCNVEEAEDSNFDCSSLCLTCYILSGLKHKKSGYTRSMRKSLMATGKFICTNDKTRTASSEYAKVGGLYLSEGHHVCMVLNDGPKADKNIEEEKTDEKNPLVEILGNVYIRMQPSSFSKALKIARAGESYNFITSSKDGNGNEWYAIELPNGLSGFVSAFTNKKKKYTKLINT